jgi:hypothetical protein
MGHLDGLTGAYRLKTAVVTPDQLLLDPNNPRLITDPRQVRPYSATELRDVEVQSRILDLVCSKEHDVRRLIQSISEIGFVGGLHEMVVKPLAPTGPYLVLEGNRRTAAIHHLLKRPERLRADVRGGLERIEVKVFEYVPNAQHDEDKVINVLLGTIHIEGPREWGALERANYITRTYRAVAGDQSFPFNVAAAREVGERFKQSTKAIHKALIICRAYDQLKRAHPELTPGSFSLIDLATATRAVAEPYFELDRGTCQLSEQGVERFIELVLVPNAPVHNPKLFRQFVDVYQDGTANELEQIVARERAVNQVWESLQRRKERRAFREQLEAVREQINALYITDFNGSEGEKALIRKIRQSVETKLAPLLDED